MRQFTAVDSMKPLLKTVALLSNGATMSYSEVSCWHGKRSAVYSMVTSVSSAGCGGSLGPSPQTPCLTSPCLSHPSWAGARAEASQFSQSPRSLSFVYLLIHQCWKLSDSFCVTVDWNSCWLVCFLWISGCKSGLTKILFGIHVGNHSLV